jgi:hypothetical protein
MEHPDRNTPFPVGSFICGGWGCLIISSLLLFISVQVLEGGTDAVSGLCLMCARIFGLGAFVAGGVAIFNKWWMHATLLVLGSIGLPMISLFWHGLL